MKNYDLLKVVASFLNGLQYPLSPERYRYGDKLLVDFCKEKGIVICYGSSDDLMELDGAICKEYGCYDGGTICFDEKGDMADASNYYPITAVWDKDDISWQYEFEPKHEVFTIYEDADIYCKGIVFFMNDLKRHNESGCKFCKDYTHDDFQHNIELARGDNEKLGLAIDFMNLTYSKRIVAYAHSSANTENATAYYYPKYCPECGRKLHD